MHLTLNLNVQVKDGTLVLTDCAGKIVTFSQEQPVQKKVSMQYRKSHAVPVAGSADHR